MENQSTAEKYGEFHYALGQKMRKLFGFDVFGVDLIIGEKCGKAYILDINYLPSFKTAKNMSSLFWSHVLEEYYSFVGC